MKQLLNQQNSFWRRHSDLGAGLLLLLLTLLFFNTALLPPHGQVMGGHDMRGYYYPYYEAVREALRNGRLPFWEPTLFNGFPFMAQPQQNTFYPPAWINLVLPTNVGVSWFMTFHIWLAGFGMYAFVRYLKGSWLPALLAGIIFAFSGLLAGRLWAGHSAVYAIDAWTPWLLLALAWCVRRRTIWAAIIAGLPMGLAILAGHIPSFLYVGMIWGAFALFLWLTERGQRLLVVRQTAVMFLVGLALAAVQLAPFVEFSLASGRVAEADYEFASAYSLPPAHLMTLIVPEFFGEPTRVGYWSVPTFEELTYYAGVLVLLGLVLALRKPTRLSWFYVVLMITGLALALGSYGVLYPLAYKFIPIFQIVRAPGRAAFLFMFAAAALFGHVLSHWQQLPVDERVKRLASVWRWALLVTAVLGVVAIASTGAVFMALHPTDTSGRLWHQVGGYSIALFVTLMGGGLLWAYLTTEKSAQTRRQLLGVALLLLVVSDMWLFAFKFVRLEPVTPDAFWVDARAFIGDTTERILPWGVSLFDQNGAMQVGLNSVFGYDSLEPAAHIALASSVVDPRSSAYDVLAARYVIAPTELEGFEDGERPLTFLAQNGAAWIYERARPMAVARLVYEAEIIPDANAAITRIHQPDFDPGLTAILAEAPACDLKSGQGTAVVESTSAGQWQVRTNSDTPGLLILAATAYPGWQVTIDNQPAQPLTAYTTLRAVCVPVGEHLVTWNYVPTIYWVGGLVTAVTILFVLFALLFRKNYRREGS